MSTEHVVAARADTLYGHAEATPDAICSCHAYHKGTKQIHIRIIDGKILLIALQMRARYTERRDQHGDAAQQKHSAGQCKEATQQHHTIFMKDEHNQPYGEQKRTSNFTHIERPRNMRHIIQKYVRQRGITFHVGHTLMHNHHDKRCDPSDDKRVAWKDETMLPSGKLKGT